MECKCKFEVAGKVLEIGEIQTFASGFTKRTIIVEASRDAEKFPNPVCLTMKKDSTAMADSLSVGDAVTAEGFVEGRRWEGPNGVRYFIDLNAKSVIVVDRAPKPTTAKNWDELVAVGAAHGMEMEAVKELCKSYGKAFKDMAERDWAKLAEGIVAPAASTAEESDPDDLPF